MIAKLNNKCPICGGAIIAGETIIRKRGTRYGHDVCPVKVSENVAQTPKNALPSVSVQPSAVSDIDDLISGIVESDTVSEAQEIVDTSPAKVFAPSAFQQAFYYAMASKQGNIALKATAGSGKSTTLKNSTPYLDPNSKVAAIVFARRNSDDLKKVMPSWVTACTTHSLALKNVKRAYPKVEIDEGGKKLWGILRELGRENHSYSQILNESGADIRKLIGLRKNTLKSDWDYIATRYGVTLDEPATAYAIAEKAFERSIADMSLVDFDDMLYHCAVGNVACDKYDTLLVDECQDYNKAQTEFSLRSLAEGGRMLMVGDPMQSIFGFRGAEVDAFEQLVNATGAKVMPLSITYRLPLSHVELVQSLFPEAQMLPRDNAPRGEISELAESDLIRNVQPGDMVVCRLNAPLVAPCFELIRNGVKAMIAGRDVGKGLEHLITKCAKRSGHTSLSMLLSYMGQHVSDEVSKLTRADKGTQASKLSDEYETILAISDGCKDADEVKMKIARVFSDDVQGVVFSSVHKSKGLESDNVFILQPSLIPSKMAKQQWEIHQEHNIKFVSYTRSKHGLYFVE